MARNLVDQWVRHTMRDESRYDEWLPPSPRPAPKPHEPRVLWDAGDGPIPRTGYVGWCETCDRDSVLYPPTTAGLRQAEAWCVLHRDGAVGAYREGTGT